MAVVLLTCSIGLACSGLGMLTLDRIKQKQIFAEEMTLLARVIASRSAAALSFGDQERARDNLDSLLVRESVVLACIYDAGEQLFAQTAREFESLNFCPDHPRPSGEYYADGFLDVYQNVELSSIKIGVLMVRTSLVDVDGRLQKRVLLTVLILGLSLLMAFLLTYRLQRAIYQPIVDLDDVANKITEHNNFSIRAFLSTEDEVRGPIAAAFNAMLNKIEADKEELVRLAYYDPLTKLANRRMFSERLIFSLENARRSGEKMGLVILDIDRFKVVNEMLGHETGDMILAATAERLNNALPMNATVFRSGGDEFALLQVGVSEADLKITARKIFTEFEEPLKLSGRLFKISFSIGIAVSDGGDTADSIMKSAKAALSQAKGSGRSIYKVFDEA